MAISHLYVYSLLTAILSHCANPPILQEQSSGDEIPSFNNLFENTEEIMAHHISPENSNTFPDAIPEILEEVSLDGFYLDSGSIQTNETPRFRVISKSSQLVENVGCSYIIKLKKKTVTY